MIKYLFLVLGSIIISHQGIGQIEYPLLPEQLRLLNKLEKELFPYNTAEEQYDTLDYTPKINGLTDEVIFLIGRKNQPNLKKVRKLLSEIRQQSCISCLPKLKAFYSDFDTLFKKEWTHMTSRGRATPLNNQFRIYRSLNRTFYTLRLDRIYKNNAAKTFDHLIRELRNDTTSMETIGHLLGTMQERAVLYGPFIKTLIRSSPIDDPILADLIKPAGYSKQIGMDTVLVNRLPEFKTQQHFPTVLHALSRLQTEYGLLYWLEEVSLMPHEHQQILLFMQHSDLTRSWDLQKLKRMESFQRLFIIAAKEGQPDHRSQSYFITIIRYFDSIIAVQYLNQLLQQPDQKDQTLRALNFMLERTKAPEISKAIMAILKQHDKGF